MLFLIVEINFLAFTRGIVCLHFEYIPILLQIQLNFSGKLNTCATHKSSTQLKIKPSLNTWRSVFVKVKDVTSIPYIIYTDNPKYSPNVTYSSVDISNCCPFTN